MDGNEEKRTALRCAQLCDREAMAYRVMGDQDDDRMAEVAEDLGRQIREAFNIPPDAGLMDYPADGPKGCGFRLASECWTWCGERDMGSLPALCKECGGTFIRSEPQACIVHPDTGSIRLPAGTQSDPLDTLVAEHVPPVAVDHITNEAAHLHTLTRRDRLRRWLFPATDYPAVANLTWATDAMTAETTIALPWADRLRALVSGRVVMREVVMCEHTPGKTAAASRVYVDGPAWWPWSS